LELSAQNTYTGNTTVEAGTLRLQLPKLADTSTLSIGTTAGPPAVLDLPNSGTDVVAALIIDGASRSAGVYNSSNSGGAITGNGSIEVAASPAYLAWAATKGLGGSGGKDPSPAADPDGDGASNIAEFALNGDPLDGSSIGYMDMRTGIIPSIGLGLILTFATRAGADFTGGSTANKDGVAYTVEGSIDLNNFTSPVTEVTPAIVPAGWPATGDYEYHSFRLNASTGLTGKGFLRLKF
jgi:autotransporter-associated beta strand protein